MVDIDTGDDAAIKLPLPQEKQARKGEQRTICEACGNANLAHDRAAWTDDGTSYCPSCLPLLQEKQDD